MSLHSRKRARYVRSILSQGPTEAGYAFFRARRRRANLADADNLLAGDRLVLSADFAVDADDLQANAELVRAQLAAPPSEIDSIRWLVPGFYLVWGGGIHPILRLADHLAREHRVRSSFVVFDSTDPPVVARVKAGIGRAFPRLAGSEVHAADDRPAPADVAIATAWESVWRLVRTRDVQAKLFFIQDWEPDFYPAGSASALLEEAGRQGIPAIVNTAALADSYRSLGGPAVSFTPAVDSAVFHPPPSPRQKRPIRIVFYGRPRTSRNAFGLGLDTLRRVKEAHGDGVQILCAGEDWSPGQYGAADVLENVGMLESIEAVADLYRSCHIGLVFMLTRHPSYQPLEYMASGVATVTNENEHTGWLFEHERNALLSRPVPALVAKQVTRLVDDVALRDRVSAGGQSTVAGLSWDAGFEHVWDAMCGRARFE